MVERRADAGITLLEVLLSLAIMAMIGVGVGSLFQSGGQVWRRIDANQFVADEAVSRVELRRMLEAMPVVSPQNPIGSLFRSDGAGFSFVSELIEDSDEAMWVNVSFADGKLFVADRTTETTQAARSSLSRLAISYYGRKTVRDDARWHDDWQNAMILPKLVKIESWQSDGTANPPLAIQPAKLTRQMEISLSSLVPPD